MHCPLIAGNPDTPANLAIVNNIPVRILNPSATTLDMRVSAAAMGSTHSINPGQAAVGCLQIGLRQVPALRKVKAL